MRIHVTVPDTPELRAALTEGVDEYGLPKGTSERLGADITVHVGPTLELADSSIAGAVITAIITFMGDIGTGLVASWLWSRLSSAKGKHVEIDRRTIILDDEGQIRRIIEEHIIKSK